MLRPLYKLLALSTQI